MVIRNKIFVTALFSTIALAPAVSAAEVQNMGAQSSAQQASAVQAPANVGNTSTANSMALTENGTGVASQITSVDAVKTAVEQNIKDHIDVPTSYLANASQASPFLAGVNSVIPFEAFGGDGMLTRLLLNSSDGAPWSDNGTAMNPALLPLANLSHDYTYEVDLNGDTTKLSGADLLSYLKTQGTKTYQATVKVYSKADNSLVASKDVTIDLHGAVANTSATTDDVKAAVDQNIKSSIDVPMDYLENANGVGPFLAGVNQVIPFEAFGGDGMLTRLLLNSSDGAPWSNNGTAKNPALAPANNLGNHNYTYEVDLNGDTTKLSGNDLLNYLKAQGTKSYQATVKVYNASDDSLVTSKNVTINLNGAATKDDVKSAVNQNIKSSIDVPADYLENANGVGPFLAGVNQVIPFEAFGGDGMLTRLLLNSSDGAPWSNNGTAKNPALAPAANLANGTYTYEVDLNGDTTKLSGNDLLNYLKAQGTKTYQATVKVYNASDNSLVTSKDVTINLHGSATKTSVDTVKSAVNQNIKDTIDVPASYLKNADKADPFLAGVNQVIPFEAFGGDGMLTRLLLNSSDGAPWSDNGTAMNPALLPVENLTNGDYTYEVDLNGETTKLSGSELLTYLKDHGTNTYHATVKVYNKADGSLVASKDVTINLHGDNSVSGNDSNMTINPSNPSSNNSGNVAGMANKDTAKNMAVKAGSTNTNNGQGTTEKPMLATRAENDGSMTKSQSKQGTLPETGEKSTLWITFAGIITTLISTVGLAFRFTRR